MQKFKFYLLGLLLLVLFLLCMRYNCSRTENRENNYYIMSLFMN